MVTIQPDPTPQLRRVADAIEHGDLTAGPVARAYMAGALHAAERLTVRHEMGKGKTSDRPDDDKSP